MLFEERFRGQGTAVGGCLGSWWWLCGEGEEVMGSEGGGGGERQTLLEEPWLELVTGVDGQWGVKAVSRCPSS